jgi:hypothetical protein
MAQKSGSGLLIIERILRDRDGIWRQVVEERDLKPLTMQMVVSSVVGLACYGIVLGASHSFAQAVSSAIKLPLLFLATLAICLPTLYLFNLIFGARLSMMQAVALIMVSITVISVLALAFAPISLFFLISADNYPFFKLLNVAILVLAAFVGLKFLTSGMATLNAYQAAHSPAVEETPAAAPTAAVANGGGGDAEPVVAGLLEPANPGRTAVSTLPQAPVTLPHAPVTLPHAPVTLPHAPAVVLPRQVATPALVRTQQKPASMTLLYIWIALFGFVGTQLAWTLRPFFGSPNEPFEVFRNIEGTFYADIFRTIGHLFGG